MSRTGRHPDAQDPTGNRDEQAVQYDHVGTPSAQYGNAVAPSVMTRIFGKVTEGPVGVADADCADMTTPEILLAEARVRLAEYGPTDLDKTLALIADAKGYVTEESDPLSYVAAALQDATDMVAELHAARHANEWWANTEGRRFRFGRWELYRDRRDWWIGVFASERATYFGLLTLIAKRTRERQP